MSGLTTRLRKIVSGWFLLQLAYSLLHSFHHPLVSDVHLGSGEEPRKPLTVVFIEWRIAME